MLRERAGPLLPIHAVPPLFSVINLYSIIFLLRSRRRRDRRDLFLAVLFRCPHSQTACGVAQHNLLLPIRMAPALTPNN